MNMPHYVTDVMHLCAMDVLVSRSTCMEIRMCATAEPENTQGLVVLESLRT